MKTIRTLAVALATAAALPATALAQEVVLKFSHFLPPQAMVPSKLITPWCERIEQASKGRMKCQLYPAMQLGGNATQVFDQVRDGIADVGWAVLGYSSGRFTALDVFELPFMGASAEAHSRALWSYAQEHASKELGSVKPLMLFASDRFAIHSRSKPVQTLEDLRGLKIRAGLKTTTRFFELLGATPVSIPLPGMLDGMTKGVIDAGFATWESAIALRVHEAANHHTDGESSYPAMHMSNLAIVMNKARYDKLPDDLKKIIDANSGEEMSAYAGRLFDETAAGARKVAEERGNQFYSVPAPELDRWKQASQPVFDEWTKEANAKGYDGASLLQAARSSIAAAAAKVRQ